MQEYFKWELTLSDEDFLPPFWQQQRASDNLASVYWLYNRTGQEYLLELAEKIHRNTANWTETVASWHNVNIAQCFRGPGVYYQQSRDPYFLQAVERNYSMIWGNYGQVPGGMFGGDENCRRGYYGPRQGIETCALVEFMLSYEMLLKIAGDLTWADRCEDVAFNSFPPRDDGRPQGPALSRQPEPVPARQQEQGPRHRERRRHVLLRSAPLPLLPAQRGARLAVFRRAPVDGHARQRPGRGLLRRLARSRPRSATARRSRSRPRPSIPSRTRSD